MKAIVMTISLMVLGSCAHHHGDKAHKHGDKKAHECKADMSCCKDGSCDMKKKKS